MSYGELMSWSWGDSIYGWWEGQFGAKMTWNEEYRIHGEVELDDENGIL